MDIEETTIITSYTYTDVEIEELLTKLANEYPNKAIMRMRHPTCRYGDIEYRNVTRAFNTLGVVIRPEDVALEEIHIEELRTIIRKSDVFLLHSIIGIPDQHIDPYTFERKIKWTVRYATSTEETQ